jgi:hypothetical protein
LVNFLRKNQRLKRIEKKIANPNKLKTRFHRFIFWKDTKELHNFDDKERVQIILGHKTQNSTETYVPQDALHIKGKIYGKML